MINFNFLGMGSFSGVQQKGKVNGANNADSENGVVLVDGEMQNTAAAFPNMLMQLMLGQQLPIIIPVVTNQQPNTSDDNPVPEPVASNTQLMTASTQLPLQDQLLACEMKKNSAIKKGSIQKAVPDEAKITLEQDTDITVSELPLEKVREGSSEAETQGQNNNPESKQIISDAKIVLDGLDVFPQQTAANVSQQTLSGQQNGITVNHAAVVDQNVSSAVKQSVPMAEVRVSAFTKNNGTEAVINESEIEKNAPPKVSLEGNNLLIKENEKPEGTSKIGLSTVALKTQQISPEKEVQKANSTVKEIENSESPGGTIAAEKETKTQFVRNPLSKGETIARNDLPSIQHQANKKIVKEPEITAVMSDDVQQRGILSNVTVHTIKTSKLNGEQSPTILRSEPSEKSAIPTTIETVSPENVNRNESQNQGSGSFTPKENFERSTTPEKNIAPVDGRQGQQTFTGILEEKNNGIVSKVHHADVSTLLRQQDTVNNVIDQLAKNVTLSVNENNSQIKISLKPEALGDVMLKVTMDHGKISTQMEVQQPQVKAVIEANIQILRDSLSSKGLVLDKIDISTSQYLPNEKSSHHGQQQSGLKNYFGKEIDEDITEQTKLFGYNTVDYVA